MINLEMLELIAPALVAGVLISLTHGLLGKKVLEKGIIFIDLAIAQIAGLGMVIANIFLPDHTCLSQLIIILFALSASIFFYYIEKTFPDIQEAIIGCSFILAASCTILFLSGHPHSSDNMMHLLSGQILFITFQDIIWHSVIYLAILSLWFLQRSARDNIAFYIIFAFAVVSSVQLVGIYLVFASLILPALASKNKKNSLLISWTYGILSVVFGLIMAVNFDLPAGIAIVITYFILGLLIFLLRLK